MGANSSAAPVLFVPSPSVPTLLSIRIGPPKRQPVSRCCGDAPYTIPPTTTEALERMALRWEAVSPNSMAGGCSWKGPHSAQQMVRLLKSLTTLPARVVRRSEIGKGTEPGHSLEQLGPPSSPPS